jgi:uncharacterized protein YcfL
VHENYGGLNMERLIRSGTNIRKIFKLVVALIILIIFTACVPKNTHFKNGKAMPLDTWLDEVAGPELTQLMGEHPMFKNQPFLIAALCDERIQPVQDGVTRQIREHLHRYLLNKPGVALAWRPDVSKPMDFQDLSDPGNKQLEKIRYYVGIAAFIDPLDGFLKVNIKILDVDEKKWISLLNLYWQGNPTDTQKRILMQNGEIDPSKFNIIDNSLKKAISITGISSAINQSDFMEVQVTGRNTSSSYIALKYKVKWFDENDLEIPTILSHWTKTPAYAKSEFGFKAVAPRVTAKDYRIFIRKGGN